jgi:hypothetical protein
MTTKLNPRKFRVWEEGVIYNSLQICVSFKLAIEKAAGELQVPEDLPNAIISAAELYDIVCGFAAMYDKLLVEDLIRSNTNINGLNKNFH